MKDETRRGYEQQVWDAQREMQKLAPLAQSGGSLDKEWRPVWEKLENVIRLLQIQTINATDVTNALNPTLRSVRRLITLYTGVTLAEQYEAEEEEDVEIKELLPEPKTFGPRKKIELMDLVVRRLNASRQLLLLCYEDVVREHPPIENLMIVQDIKNMAKSIGDLPRDFSKIQGINDVRARIRDWKDVDLPDQNYLFKRFEGPELLPKPVEEKAE